MSTGSVDVTTVCLSCIHNWCHRLPGQALHAVGLTTMWKSYLDFDIANDGTTIAGVLSGKDTQHSEGRPIGKGMACVSNFGDWANFTGHVLSASNVYGCGRLAWDPTQTSSTIHAEWVSMTFARPAASDLARATVNTAITSILDRGWLAFEGYTSPNGIGFMCTGCDSGMSPEGCAPQTKGPGRGPGGEACPFNANPDDLQAVRHGGILVGSRTGTRPGIIL
jgi:alpha-glucuronidase